MSTALFENILNQAQALRQIVDYQLGPGRAALERAAALLKSRRRILLSGMGASFYACIPFEYSLAQRGFSVHSIEAGELFYFLSAPVDAQTAAVLVSRSGESVEVRKLLPMLRQAGAVALGVANVPDTFLTREADEAIMMGSPTDHFVAIQTYTGTIATFALLEAAMVGELEKARAELQRAIELLERVIPEWVRASETWHPFLDGDAPMYLLGRGPSLGAVVEGVLLMHETAKAPAVGMSVAQFRHGPVEVVDGRFRGIVLGTQEATADLDAALARDLNGMGGQVRTLGPISATNKTTELCSWPDGIPSRFVPIFETVPLQLAAYRKAEMRGVTPGDFRWAPLVTNSESGFSGVVR